MMMSYGGDGRIIPLAHAVRIIIVVSFIPFYLTFVEGLDLPVLVGREILAAGLENRAFIDNATTDFEAYKASVEPYTLEYAEKITSLPRECIREMAHAYARMFTRLETMRGCIALSVAEVLGNVLVAVCNLGLLLAPH